MTAVRISPQASTDSMLTRAKSGPQRSGARVLTEDRDCVVNVRGIPVQKLVRALRCAKESGRALDVAVCTAAAGGPEGGQGGIQGGIQGTEPPIKGP